MANARRPYGPATFWLGIALWLGMLFPAQAQTCPSTNGGADFTFVDNGSATNYNVGAGQSLLIQSGTYTGFLDGPASGALVCVNPGATFQPGGANNFAGTLQNHGTSMLVGINFNTGSTLDNREGLLTFDDTNANGTIAITNAAGARIEVMDSITLVGTAIVLNDGDIDIAAGASLELQGGTNVTNNGRIELHGDNLNLGGTVVNNGYIFGMGVFNVNGGSLTNACSIVANDQIINGGTLTNDGFLLVTDGAFINNGNLSQGPDGVASGTDFSNDASVSGRGRYHFTGNTLNQGPFNGAGPLTPIVFFDETRDPPPDYFDIENTVPTNTVRSSFLAPTPVQALASCDPPYPDVPQVDASVTKDSDVASVPVGGTLIYTVVVANAGPDGAEGTMLQDTPDAGLTCTTVACTASSGGAECPLPGSGPGQLSIDNLLGDGVEIEQLPAGGELTFELECTVDAAP